MSVDTVIHSISRLHRRFTEHPESFSPAGRSLVLAVLGCMRDPLMKEDVEGFNSYIDGLLGREPDMADFILDELFEHLGIHDRDQLSAILAAE